MSDILADVRTHLLNYTGITDVVGSRIRPEVLDQGDALPAATIELDRSDSEQHLEGIEGLATDIVTVIFYGNTPSDIESARDVCRIAMQQHFGSMGDTNVSGIVVNTKYNRARSPDDGTATWRHARAITFEIVHREAITE